MKKTIIFSTFFLLFFINISHSAFAQYGIGMKASMFAPRGDLGAIYKKSAMYDGFIVVEHFKGRFKQRLGFFYTKLSPRLDTFRSYGVVSSNGSTVYPGYTVYDYFSLMGFYIDNNLRFLQYKGFSLYGGIGITVGWYKQKYERDIEAIISESGYEFDDAGGLRFNLHAAYNINKNLQVYVEGMHNLIVKTDWSRHFSHNAIGVGVNYILYFKDEKE